MRSPEELSVLPSADYPSAFLRSVLLNFAFVLVGRRGNDLRGKGAWGVDGNGPHRPQDHLSGELLTDSSRASLWPGA